MTLNGVIVVILRFFSPNSIALLANCVTVVEGRPIMSVNVVSQFQSSTLAITNPPFSTVSLRQLSYLYFLFTLWSKTIGRAQGGARAVDLPARWFDLAHPGVAPPLGVTCNPPRLKDKAPIKESSYYATDRPCCLRENLSSYYFIVAELPHAEQLIAVTRRTSTNVLRITVAQCHPVKDFTHRLLPTVHLESPCSVLNIPGITANPHV